MGVIWQSNLALSIPLLLAVLAEVEVRISDAVEDEDHNLWIVFLDKSNHTRVNLRIVAT